MFLSALYFLVVLTLCVSAVADCLRPGREGHSGPRRSGPLTAGRKLLVRLSAPWIGAWFLFQVASALVFLALGAAHLVMPYMVYFGSLTLLLPFLILAGAEWTRDSGAPLFPWIRGVRRRNPRARRKGVRLITELVLLALIPVAFTSAVFLSVQWSPDQKLGSALQPEQHSSASAVLLLGYLLVSAAVIEEVLFRHYLLNRLIAAGKGFVENTRTRAFLAVLVVTLLWAMGHGGMLEPAWLKYTQIMVYGIALGVAQLRLGVEACIVLHLLYNGTALLLGLRMGSGT